MEEASCLGQKPGCFPLGMQTDTLVVFFLLGDCSRVHLGKGSLRSLHVMSHYSSVSMSTNNVCLEVWKPYNDALSFLQTPVDVSTFFFFCHFCFPHCLNLFTFFLSVWPPFPVDYLLLITYLTIFLLDPTLHTGTEAATLRCYMLLPSSQPFHDFSLHQGQF